MNALIGKYQNLIWFNILYYYYLKIDLIHVLQKYEFNVYSIITIRNLYYEVFILMKVNTQILARSFDFCGDFVMDNLGSQTKPLTSFTFKWTWNWGIWLWCFTPHSTIFHWYRGGNRSTRRKPPTYRKRYLTHIFKVDYCFLVMSVDGLLCY